MSACSRAVASSVGVLEREIALGAKYGLSNSFDKMVVYPSASTRVDYSGNVKLMLMPIVDTAVFVAEWVGAKLGIIYTMAYEVSRNGRLPYACFGRQVMGVGLCIICVQHQGTPLTSLYANLM